MIKNQTYRFIILSFWLGCSFPAISQEEVVLELSDLYSIVFENHPVARQANLLPEQARNNITRSRGAFDPTLNAFANQKEFDGKHYYTRFKSELNVPTWFGFDVRGGFEYNTGMMLNPESTAPNIGLFYTGISVPIGQGMVIDQRRATLRQAQLFEQIATADRVQMLNDLLLRVGIDYWDWMFQYNRFRVLEDGYRLALFRYNAVKERVEQGDLAPIDSVEALIEVQSRQQNRDQARIDYNNSMLRLSNHLWGENNIPLEITELIIPQQDPQIESVIDLGTLNQLIQRSQQEHPILQNFRTTLRQMDVERRFKADLIRPRLSFHFDVYQHPDNLTPEDLNIGFRNNYRVGVGLNYPLFTRRERGDLKLLKLQMQDTELEIDFKSREISNRIRSSYNELTNYSELLTTQENIVENYVVLRDGEETKFLQGESSLFLINTREKQLISSQEKFYELQSKFALAQTKLNWEAGILAEEEINPGVDGD